MICFISKRNTLIAIHVERRSVTLAPRNARVSLKG